MPVICNQTIFTFELTARCGTKKHKMENNFDEITERRNTNCFKWDLDSGDILPMWVADMDFKTAPAVIQALTERTAHGIFGYSLTPPAFYEAITGWWNKRHGLSINKDWIVPTPGILPALSATLRGLTSKGSKVVIQPPVYNHFFVTIEQGDCQLIENNLVYEEGQYYIDFEDLDKKLAAPEVKLLLLSNPHNPAGRVWTREELQRIGDISLKNKVIVLSDEIHSDLVYKEHSHIPFASLGQEYSLNSITFGSPSKTFNLAGLQTAYFFTENEELRKTITEVLQKQEMTLLNVFAVEGLIAAYEKGETWLDELRTYLYDNYLYLKTFCSTFLPEAGISPLEGTYLVWINCSAFGIHSDALADRLLQNEQLRISPGSIFGKPGDYFIRVNIACPRSLLQEGLERLARELKRTGPA